MRLSSRSVSSVASKNGGHGGSVLRRLGMGLLVVAAAGAFGSADARAGACRYAKHPQGEQAAS